MCTMDVSRVVDVSVDVCILFKQQRRCQQYGVHVTIAFVPRSARIGRATDTFACLLAFERKLSEA